MQNDAVIKIEIVSVPYPTLSIHVAMGYNMENTVFIDGETTSNLSIIIDILLNIG